MAKSKHRREPRKFIGLGEYSETYAQFFGKDVLRVCLKSTGLAWLRVDQICAAMGIDYEAQRKKLTDPRRGRWAKVADLKIYGTKPVLVIASSSIDRWLSGISTNALGDDVANSVVVALEALRAAYRKRHPFG